MATQIESPFDMFNGLDGKPLTNGKVYIGQVGTDPTVTANQIPIFWDKAMTIPAAQPLRTNAGYIVRNGSPSRVYAASDYSMSVANSSDVLVYYIAQFGTGQDLSDALQLADYAALRSYTGDRNMVYVMGSGISGVFIAYRGSFDVDNGGTTIVASNGVRWKRQYTGFIEVDWFGAFGVPDSQPAISNAIAYADTVSGDLGFRAGSTYIMGGGISWNSTRVGMNGRGCELRTNFISGILLRPMQSGIDTNERISAAANHPFENFNLRGPGYSNTNVIAMRIEDVTAEQTNAGNIIRSVAFKAFAIDLQYGQGCFCTRVESCDFQNVIGSGNNDTVASIQIEFQANSGERNTFTGCFMGNRNYVFRQVNGNADTHFIDCSFNYPQAVIGVVEAGSVTLSNCHIEGAKDVNRWWVVSGQNSLLNVISTNLIMADNKPNFAPFFSDATCSNGGVVLRDLRIVSGQNTMPPRLIDGGGRTKADNLMYENAARRVITSNYENLLTYPSFESADFISDWKLGGTVPPSRTDTVTPRSGLYSLMFSPVSGNPLPSSASVSVACKAGDYGVLELYYMTINLASTGGTFYGTLGYVDRAGKPVGVTQEIMAVTTNVGLWTKIVAGLPAAAPQGTYAMVAFFNLFGTTSGAPKGYLDDVSITIG